MPGWAAATQVLLRGRHPGGQKSKEVSCFICVVCESFAPMLGSLQGCVLREQASLTATLWKLLWPHVQQEEMLMNQPMRSCGPVSRVRAAGEMDPGDDMLSSHKVLYLMETLVNSAVLLDNLFLPELGSPASLSSRGSTNVLLVSDGSSGTAQISTVTGTGQNAALRSRPGQAGTHPALQVGGSQSQALKSSNSLVKQLQAITAVMLVRMPREATIGSVQHRCAVWDPSMVRQRLGPTLSAAECGIEEHGHVTSVQVWSSTRKATYTCWCGLGLLCGTAPT